MAIDQGACSIEGGEIFARSLGRETSTEAWDGGKMRDLIYRD